MKYIIDFQSKVIEMGDARNIASDDLMVSFSENFNEATHGIVVEWEAGETTFKVSKIGIVTEPYEKSLGLDEETGEELFETVTPPPLLTLKKGKTLSSLETIINDALYVDPKLQAKEFIRIQIDRFRTQLLGKYTETEQRGWVLFLPEAKAYLASENPGDAPGLSLQAAIEQTPLKDVAKGIIAAAGVTGMLPHLAAGVRSKANDLIDSTDGSPEAIKAVTDLLTTKQTSIAIAIQSGDQAAVLEAATSGWGI